MLKDKLHAFLIHLVISATIVGLFLLLVTQIWYPHPYFEVSGLLPILALLISVDVILGPSLTFIIYKKHKRTLKFDLSVIVLTQLCAFGYGVYSIYQVHPVYAVYSFDRIALVTPQNIAKKPEQYAKYFDVSSFGKPTLVNAKMPSDPEKEQEILMGAIMGTGDDLEYRPEYYEPLTEFNKAILNRSIDLKRIQKSAKANALLNKFLEKNNKKVESLAFVPLVGNVKTMMWVIDKDLKQPIGLLDVDPLSELPFIPTN